MLDAAEQVGLEEAATQSHSASELEVTVSRGHGPDCSGGCRELWLPLQLPSVLRIRPIPKLRGSVISHKAAQFQLQCSVPELFYMGCKDLIPTAPSTQPPQALKEMGREFPKGLSL